MRRWWSSCDDHSRRRWRTRRDSRGTGTNLDSRSAVHLRGDRWREDLVKQYVTFFLLFRKGHASALLRKIQTSSGRWRHLRTQSAEEEFERQGLCSLFDETLLLTTTFLLSFRLLNGRELSKQTNRCPIHFQRRHERALVLVCFSWILLFIKSWIYWKGQITGVSKEERMGIHGILLQAKDNFSWIEGQYQNLCLGNRIDFRCAITNGKERQCRNGRNNTGHEFNSSDNVVASGILRHPVVLHHPPEEKNEDDPRGKLIGTFVRKSGIEVRSEEENTSEQTC